MARQVLDNGVILPSEYSDDWYDDMTSNLTKLDEVIGSDAEKLSASDVGEAAISNDYDDLDDKPEYNILRRASIILTAGGTGNYTDLDSDSKIKAGDYVLDAANKLYSITAIDEANSTYTVSAAAIINITDKSELGAAALSNSYDDLNNLPGYGILRFCSTAITDNSSVPFSSISSVSKIASGDFLLDTAAKLYTVSAVDTANETVSVTTPLTQLAVDSDVVHKSGDETISGVKSFSDDTYIKSLNFTSEVPSQSSSSSSIFPIITTITYGDSSPSVQARLNLRVTADGIKSLYPHENNAYSLGLSSRSFSDFYSYHGYFKGQQQGDEYSGNARTNLTLTSNRDTLGQSGILFDSFRENTTQGTGSHILGIGIKENSVRYEGCRFSWFYDDDSNGYVFSLRPTTQGSNQPIKYELGNNTSKWSTINGINPGALSLPDLSNGIDISGYLSVGVSTNDSYTAPANGYIGVIYASSSACGCYVYNYTDGVFMRSNSITDSTYTNVCGCFIPILKNQTLNLSTRATESIVSAKFFPCQGNV